MEGARPPHAHTWRKTGDCPGSWEWVADVMVWQHTHPVAAVYRCTGCPDSMYVKLDPLHPGKEILQQGLHPS